MKFKLFIIVASIITLLITFSKGKSVVFDMNLDAATLQHYSSMLPKYLIFPFDTGVKMSLGMDDISAFKEYAKTLAPFIWGATLCVMIITITVISLLISMFKKIKKLTALIRRSIYYGAK